VPFHCVELATWIQPWIGTPCLVSEGTIQAKRCESVAGQIGRLPSRGIDFLMSERARAKARLGCGNVAMVARISQMVAAKLVTLRKTNPSEMLLIAGLKQGLSLL
jgi:hypothetical protein